MISFDVGESAFDFAGYGHYVLLVVVCMVLDIFQK